MFVKLVDETETVTLPSSVIVTPTTGCIYGQVVQLTVAVRPKEQKSTFSMVLAKSM